MPGTFSTGTKASKNINPDEAVAFGADTIRSQIFYLELL
jgi:molecular chaperone DnaK (HSP70)